MSARLCQAFLVSFPMVVQVKRLALAELCAGILHAWLIPVPIASGVIDSRLTNR